MMKPLVKVELESNPAVRGWSKAWNLQGLVADAKGAGKGADAVEANVGKGLGAVAKGVGKGAGEDEGVAQVLDSANIHSTASNTTSMCVFLILGVVVLRFLSFVKAYVLGQSRVT